MKTTLALAAGVLMVSVAHAQSIDIPIKSVNAQGTGDTLGTIVAAQGPYGVILTPTLKGLAPGLHGFHVHQNPDCGPAMKDGKPVPGLSAGGHYDPANTGHHAGPYGDGHLGDLPPLYVDGNGMAELPVLAPRLKVADLKGRSLMIHAGADNFSDRPKPLGGGGARMACGVIR